jgi:CHAD domain-containing protein
MMSHAGASLKNGETSVTTETVGDETTSSVGPDNPAAYAIRNALLTGDHWLRHNESAARQGDVEGVHRMRTAARRLRSNLRLFHDLFDGDWAEALAHELRWLGQLLGAVRDLDVMRERLRQSAGALEDDLGPLFASLAGRHATASSALHEALEGPRYQDLLERLSEAADHPALGDEAWERCRSALPPLVRDAWKRLSKAGRALDLSDADDAYHEVRKRAKRARHSAESVAPTLDSHASDDARRFARRAGAVQDVLGEHQDATVACQEIRRIAAERPGDGPFNLAAGRLLERQEDAARAARTKFFKTWHKLDRPKNRRWMKV